MTIALVPAEANQKSTSLTSPGPSRAICWSAPLRLLSLLSLLLLVGSLGCQCGGSEDDVIDPTNGDETDPPPEDGPRLVLGTVLSAGSLSPVEDAKVSLGDIAAQSDHRGRFAISTSSSLDPRAIEVSAEGFSSAVRAIGPSRAHRIDLGPILLVTSDASALIGPEGGRLEAPSVGVFVDVPEGAFLSPVNLHVSRIPLDDPLTTPLLLPARVPTPAGGHVSVLSALIVDSGGVQPARSLEVRAVVAGLPAGTEVPVGRFDVDLGRWVDVGLATAEDDYISFSTDHLSTFAAALPALPSDQTVAPDLSTLERSVSPFMPGDPRIDPRSGAMQIGVPIPGLIRKGEELEFSLFYDSRTVSPRLNVPVVAGDAAMGERLIAEVVAPVGRAAVEVLVEDHRAANAASGVLVELDELAGPENAAGQDSPLEAHVAMMPTGTHLSEVTLSRLGEAVLAESTSKSFVQPSTGAVIRNSSNEVVQSPHPMEHARTGTVATAVDRRDGSPFGHGWHLSGLTRLVQPWCNRSLITLAGGLDWPALVFGGIEDPVLRPMSEAFLETGVDEATLVSVMLAAADGMIYVGMPSRREIWRVSPDGVGPMLFAGGSEGQRATGEGPALELKFEMLAALSPGPHGEGILVSTDKYISHIDAVGNATRLVGSGDACEPTAGHDIRVGEPATASKFCGYRGFDSTLGADPNSSRFVFAVPWVGTFQVVDGILLELTLEGELGLSAPNVAFGPDGSLYFSSQDSPCIYVKREDEDAGELFLRCREEGSSLEDGPADLATVGGAKAMSFDQAGSLWFVDSRYHAIRRHFPGGDVLTVSARSSSSSGARPTMSGGLLGNTVPGDVRSLAVHDARRLFLAGFEPAGFLTTAPVAGDTLVSMGSGDGSILRPLADGGYVRVLESEVIERYDARGLLRSRGKPSEAPLEFAYDEDWSVDQADEICGMPEEPPRLSRILLTGEELWSFRYDLQGRLDAITDAANRSVSRSSPSASQDRFELPCGEVVTARYDSGGRLIEKSAPGPGNLADVWSFEWDGRDLASFTAPGGEVRLVSSADSSIRVSEESFDAAGVARSVPARIPTGHVPGRGGRSTSVIVGTRGVTVAGPDGDETQLETDALGRLLRVELPDGASLRLARDEVGRLVGLVNEVTGDEWTYRHGRVVFEGENVPYLHERLLERRDRRQGVTLFEYDSQGALRRRTDPNGGMTGIESDHVGAASGLPVRLTDPEGRFFQIEYDERGNMVRMVARDPTDDSLRLTTEIQRDAVGRPARITEPSGRVLWLEYDVWNAPTRVTVGDPDDGHSMRFARATSAAWPKAGSGSSVSPVLEAVDGEGRRWSFEWAPGWIPLSSDEPGRGLSTESYDLHGRLTERAIADGSREELTYDDSGRLVQRRWLGPAEGAWAAFGYDDNGRVTQIEGASTREIREIIAGFGWSSMRITPRGDLPAAAEFAMQRGHSFRDVFVELSGGSRFTVRRGFDDQVEKVTITEPSHFPVDVLEVERDLARRIVGLTRGNGTQTRLHWDSLGRAVLQEEETPTGTVTISWEYVSDRPASVTIEGVTREYSFDERGRLTACSDTEEIYTYDRADGRTSADGRLYERDSRGRLLTDGRHQYQYDLLGRRVTKVSSVDDADRTVYRYGAGGYLEAVLRGPEGEEAEVATYHYDAMGRRIARGTQEGLWHYGYLPDTDRLVRVVEPDGTEWHLFHASPAAAWSVAAASDGRRLYTHLDPFDRVIGLSNQDGELFLLDEDCFGQPLGEPDELGPPIGFHGMHYDVETGLYYAGARFYDPLVGSFLSPDPLALLAAPSLYDYAGGNPVMAQDASGRLLFWAAVGAVAAGGIIFNEIRKLAQSDDVKKTRRSYEVMTDVVDSDDALGEATKAHSRLHRSFVKGGQTAVKSTVQGIGAVTSPAGSALEAAESVRDLVESFMDSDSCPYDYADPDPDW